MDLHAAAAELIALRTLPHLLRRLRQQAAIELRRRDVADHGLGRLQLRAIGQRHPGGALLAAFAVGEDARHVGMGADLAAMQRNETG